MATAWFSAKKWRVPESTPWANKLAGALAKHSKTSNCRNLVFTCINNNCAGKALLVRVS
jgi:hypothetical protein